VLTFCEIGELVYFCIGKIGDAITVDLHSVLIDLTPIFDLFLAFFDSMITDPMSETSTLGPIDPASIPEEKEEEKAAPWIIRKLVGVSELLF